MTRGRRGGIAAQRAAAALEHSSLRRIFVSFHGGLDRHDGDPAAADNRYRAAVVLADQASRDLPGACFTDLAAALADEPHRELWHALSNGLARSSAHLVLITGDLADARRATRCHLVDAAIMKALEQGVPQLGVHVDAIPAADGRPGERGPDPFVDHPVLVRERALPVPVHDYVAGHGAVALPRWIDGAVVARAGLLRRRATEGL